MNISLFSIVFCFSVLAFADPVVLPVNQHIPESSWFERAPELAKKFVQGVGFSIRNTKIGRTVEKIVGEVTSSEIGVLLPQYIKRALGSVSENPLFALADKLAADRWLQDKADTHKKYGGSTNSDTPPVFNQKHLREHVHAYAVLQNNKDADVEATVGSTEDSNAKLPPEHQHQGPVGWQAPAAPAAAAAGSTAAPNAAPTHNQYTSGVRLASNAPADPIKSLSPAVQVLHRRDAETFVRYTIPKELKWKGKAMVAQTNFGVRHPNCVMPLSATKHRDGRLTVDAEYGDAGPLSIYVAFFQPEQRVRVAKAVAKQVLLALVYFDVVHGLAHRNVCPSTVFLRRDGCVKLGCFNLIDPSVVQENPTWYTDNPYCAPEYRNDVEARCNSDSTQDVWSVGALILAIVTGKTLQPKVNKTRFGCAPEVPMPVQETAYRNEQSVFEELVMEGSDEDWKRVIEDDLLRHLCRRCLRPNPQYRASLLEAVALTFLFGGVHGEAPRPAQQLDRPRTVSFAATNDAPPEAARAPNPWATEISVLLGDAAPQQPAPSSPAASAAAQATESADVAQAPNDSNTIFSAAQATESTDVAQAPNGSNAIFSAGPKIFGVIKKPFKFTKGTDFAIEGTDAENLRAIAKALTDELVAMREARNVSKEARPSVEKMYREVVRDRSSLAWKAVAVAVDQVRQITAEFLKNKQDAPAPAAAAAAPAAAAAAPAAAAAAPVVTARGEQQRQQQQQQQRQQQQQQQQRASSNSAGRTAAAAAQ